MLLNIELYFSLIIYCVETCSGAFYRRKTFVTTIGMNISRQARTSLWLSRNRFSTELKTSSAMSGAVNFTFSYSV